MRASAGFPLAAVLAAALAAAPGCTQRRTVCGDYLPGGGPPVIATRDGELCESVRLRVLDHLGRLPQFSPEEAEILRDLTWRWEDAKTVDGFLRRAREDAGEPFAAALEQAVREVAEHGTKPPRADCESEERCLVRGAALGARIALDDAADVLRQMRRAASKWQPAKPGELKD